MTRNTSRPPSSAGNGRRFITPRFAESRTARLSIFIHSIMVPSLLLSSYVVPIASTIPTGPLRFFHSKLSADQLFQAQQIVVRIIYFTSTAPYFTTFSPLELFQNTYCRKILIAAVRYSFGVIVAIIFQSISWT